jgi:hypothetical protein
MSCDCTACNGPYRSPDSIELARQYLAGKIEEEQAEKAAAAEQVPAVEEGFLGTAAEMLAAVLEGRVEATHDEIVQSALLVLAITLARASDRDGAIRIRRVD